MTPALPHDAPVGVPFEEEEVGQVRKSQEPFHHEKDFHFCSLFPAPLAKSRTPSLILPAVSLGAGVPVVLWMIMELGTAPSHGIFSVGNGLGPATCKGRWTLSQQDVKCGQMWANLPSGRSIKNLTCRGLLFSLFLATRLLYLPLCVGQDNGPPKMCVPIPEPPKGYLP